MIWQKWLLGDPLQKQLNNFIRRQKTLPPEGVAYHNNNFLKRIFSEVVSIQNDLVEMITV